MTHIMLDLETWGKTPGCDIRSIGAVVFDPIAGTVGDEPCIIPGSPATFYIATENPAGRMRNGIFEPSLATGVEDYRKYPLTREPETVKFWNDQSAEAQAAFANPVDLHDACLWFGKWLYSLTDTAWYPEHHLHGFEHVRLWAHGPQFDISILDAVYRAVGLPTPWHYRAPRDTRTILEAAGIDPHKGLEAFNHGTAHNALDDAISQAMAVCEAYKRLHDHAILRAD